MAEPYHGRCAAAAIIGISSVLAAVIGCSDRSTSKPPGDDAATTTLTIETPEASGSRRCVAEPYAKTIELAEASGVARLASGELLVVADSGHRGATMRVAADTGEARQKGALPIKLKRLGDDIEGLTREGDSLLALFSSGALVELEPAGDGFRVVGEPTVIAANPGCSLRAGNCGYNWEGICAGSIRAPAFAGCLGVAVSKRDGALYCLERSETGTIVADTDRSVVVGRPETLSGCDIDDDGVIWVASNILGANTVISVGDGEPRRYPTLAAGSIEAISVTSTRGGVVELVLFSDTNIAESSAFRYRCGPQL